MRLGDLHVDPGFGFPIFGEGSVEGLIQLTRGVVGNVQQFHGTGGVKERKGKSGDEGGD